MNKHTPSLAAELLAELLLQGEVIEIVNTHGVAHLAHGLRGHFACLLRATAQDVKDGGNVLLKLVAALAHRLQHVVDNGVEELLALHVAQSATAVVVLQLVKVLVVGPEIGEVGIGGEGVEISEHGVALHGAGVGDVEVVYMERTFCHTSSAESLR